MKLLNANIQDQDFSLPLPTSLLTCLQCFRLKRIFDYICLCCKIGRVQIKVIIDINYTTQTLIIINVLFLFTGHTGHLTPKILLYIYSRTIYMQTCHINFRCLRALLADLLKRWNTPEIKVITAAYSIQGCHFPSLTGSLNCKL